MTKRTYYVIKMTGQAVYRKEVRVIFRLPKEGLEPPVMPREGEEFRFEVQEIVPSDVVRILPRAP